MAIYQVRAETEDILGLVVVSDRLYRAATPDEAAKKMENWIIWEGLNTKAEFVIKVRKIMDVNDHPPAK